VKIESAPGVAVIVTGESLTNDAEQAAPQLMPAGADVTVPVPSPCRMAASVSICLTVTVVLPAFPNASVAVIVAVPGPTAVTSPVALTVATFGLLLVHVMPVPCIFTGVSEFVAVPAPNSPRSFSPQQRTDVSGSSAHVCPAPSATARGLAMP